MIITDHAKDRLKERMGLNKKSINRVCILALERGYKHSDFTGSFGKYLDKLYLSHKNANNMRIYNNEVFIFNNETLVTVIDIPQKYNKYIKNK